MTRFSTWLVKSQDLTSSAGPLIEETHTNVAYWETSGNLPRSDVLLPMAQALGVSVEELLGAPKPKASGKPAGKAQQLFSAVSKLPRRQQEKIFDILRPFVREQAGSQPS